jgi:hypothetical protein
VAQGGCRFAFSYYFSGNSAAKFSEKDAEHSATRWHKCE